MSSIKRILSSSDKIMSTYLKLHYSILAKSSHTFNTLRKNKFESSEQKYAKHKKL